MTLRECKSVSCECGERKRYIYVCNYRKGKAILMGVNVRVIGENDNTDEYQAAEYMRQVLSDTIPGNAEGEIILYPSAYISGQNVKDIDLLMIGQLENCEVRCDFTSVENEPINDNVKIDSFCVAIELKSHGVNAIMRQGTDWYVKYPSRDHNVTKQSNEQKIAVMRFFDETLQVPVFATNLIWFEELSKQELNSLLSVGGKRIKSNVFCREVSFKYLIQLLLWQKQPYKIGKNYVFNSFNKGCDINKIKQSIEFFWKEKRVIGELTRKRVEMITKSDFSDKQIIKSEDSNISIYRGRAGTGKTVGLIQTAIQLVDEEQARVLILTYNKALVSDIRRLFALANLPDMFDVNCVSIMTLHSYFYRLINKCLYEGELDGETFINSYEKYLIELLGFLKEDSVAIEMVKEICRNDPKLDWDYLFIDEAQDWSDSERDIVLNLFEHNQILVADGGQQFVRNIKPCDWSIVRDRKNIKLKKCLRQKSNLIKFVNHYSESFGIPTTRVVGSEKMLGGRIIIVSDKDKLIPIVKQEYQNLINNGNIPYDMLVFSPRDMVNKTDDIGYKDIESFRTAGFDVWDGTVSGNRDEGFASNNQIRLFQYDSGRGLEGWSVVCLDYDAFLNDKKNHFDYNYQIDELLLESKEEKLEKYLLNWGLIPITRAIDTLIISIRDIESEFSKILRLIAYENSDYVDWV